MSAITIPTHAGWALSAHFDAAAGEAKATAIFAHCFTCSKQSVAARRIASALNELGVSVMRFDFAGIGRSEGDFSDTTFQSNVDDLVAVSEYLSTQGMPPSLLIGHSLGGAAVLQAAPMIDSAVGVVTIGAPADPKHVTHHFEHVLDTVRKEGKAPVQFGPQTLNVGQGMVDDLAQQDLQPALAGLQKALLVLHAPLDRVVGVENAAAIFAGAKHPKSYISLDDADHLITRASDAQYIAGIIGAWSQRYLNKPASKEATPPAAAPTATAPVAPVAPAPVTPAPAAPAATSAARDGVVSVRSGSAPYAQTISCGPHQWVADEPASIGGGDTGPTPYQLLSSALGVCTNVTLQLVAARKGWPLAKVEVDVTHYKDEQKRDHFSRTLHLSGELTETQRQSLLDISSRCPVHKTLHEGADVSTKLAPQGQTDARMR